MTFRQFAMYDGLRMCAGRFYVRWVRCAGHVQIKGSEWRPSSAWLAVDMTLKGGDSGRSHRQLIDKKA